MKKSSNLEKGHKKEILYTRKKLENFSQWSWNYNKRNFPLLNYYLCTTELVFSHSCYNTFKPKVLDANSVTRMVNELRTTVPQPPGVTFKVMRQDDRSTLLINNVEEMEVLPSTSREEFTVLDIVTSKGIYWIKNIFIFFSKILKIMEMTNFIFKMFKIFEYP